MIITSRLEEQQSRWSSRAGSANDPHTISKTRLNCANQTSDIRNTTQHNTHDTTQYKQHDTTLLGVFDYLNSLYGIDWV